jgi:hypothetical protein
MRENLRALAGRGTMPTAKASSEHSSEKRFTRKIDLRGSQTFPTPHIKRNVSEVFRFVVLESPDGSQRAIVDIAPDQGTIRLRSTSTGKTRDLVGKGRTGLKNVDWSAHGKASWFPGVITNGIVHCYNKCHARWQSYCAASFQQLHPACDPVTGQAIIGHSGRQRYEERVADRQFLMVSCKRPSQPIDLPDAEISPFMRGPA